MKVFCTGSKAVYIENRRTLLKGELGVIQIYFKKISLQSASTKLFGGFGSFYFALVA